MSDKLKKIYFYYPKGERLTGQELASRMILDLLDGEWEFVPKKIPAFERGSKTFFYRFFYVIKVLKVWLSFLKLIFVKKPVIYLNLGQSLSSLVRDGLPLMFLSWIRWDLRCVISLHGHVFTTWIPKEFTSKSFVKVLKKSEAITVLGEVQKAKLIDLGIDVSKIVILNNTCEIEGFEPKEKTKEEVNLLYLSNLIKSKGYREYLEAIEELSKSNLDFKINAMLCGLVTISGTSDSDESAELSEKWIYSIIERINRSEKVSVKWIKGAYGEEKRRLFEKADIFVFPSRYPVEAQPLVLLEAMSMGCAIVTTKVGEIPSTVSEECSILLEKPTPQEISQAIVKIYSEGIQNYSSKGIQRYEEKFSQRIYAENWRALFSKLTNKVDMGNEV